MCRTDRVTLVDTYQFNNTANNEFEREPYCVKFHLHDTGVPTGIRFQKLSADDDGVLGMEPWSRGRDPGGVYG